MFYTSWLFIAFLSISLGMDVQYKPENASAVRMGIELELQEITYNVPKNITFMDHIRLFESSKQDQEKKPNWYLEVDGSGNLEFVSRDFDLETEADTLKKSLQEMQHLMCFILENATVKQLNDEVLLYCIINKNQQILNLGSFVHWKPKIKGEFELINHPIEIKIKNPFCYVRPQATFQFSLRHTQKLSNYMAFRHHNLSKAIKEINVLLQEEKVEKSCTPGQGLAYLVMLTSELLKSNYSKEELGPKGVLTLMSRASFSEMYKKLEELDKQEFNKIIDVYSKKYGNENLFKQPYAIFYGKDITQDKTNDIGALIEGTKINDFIESVIKPNKSELKVKQANLLLKQALEKINKNTDYIVEELKNINLGVFDFQGKDILSPPLFLRHTYSLGKLKDFPSNIAILEMRGYTAQYKNTMKMGKMANIWLNREIENALKLWDPNTIIKIEEYEKQAQEVNKQYNELPVVVRENNTNDIEYWLKQGVEKISKKMQTTSSQNYTGFFTKLEEIKGQFLEDRIHKIQPDVLEGKRKYVIELLKKLN